MNKTCKTILILVTLIFLLLSYLLNSKYIIECILDYSILFLTKLFPVNFIFFIISSLLLDYGIIEYIRKIFRVNSTKTFLFILSMISGFPSGSKYTNDLLNKGYINTITANKYVMFSHFPNPLFILGSVNSLLNDLYLSYAILFSIIISNFIIMIFSSDKTNNSSNYITSYNSKNYLTIAVNNSFNIIITIYGISLFYYLISCIISKLFAFSGYLYVFICGFFDLTKGVFSTIIVSNIIFKALFILLFISFGSLSIHMQVKSILNEGKIKYSYFLLGRIIGTMLSFIIFMFFILIKKDLYL